MALWLCGLHRAGQRGQIGRVSSGLWCAGVGETKSTGTDLAQAVGRSLSGLVLPVVQDEELLISQEVAALIIPKLRAGYSLSLFPDSAGGWLCALDNPPTFNMGAGLSPAWAALAVLHNFPPHTP